MVDFSTIGAEVTKRGPMDRVLPAPMLDAQNIFSKLMLRGDNTAIDAVNLASDVSSILMNTKGSELDQLWERIEKGLNGNKPIQVQAEDDLGKLNTALGLIYAAMEKVDKGDSIANVRAVRSMFSSVSGLVTSRFATTSTTELKDRRGIIRTLDTMSSFFDKVAKRFNNRVKNSEIQGPEIPLFS